MSATDTYSCPVEDCDYEIFAVGLQDPDEPDYYAEDIEQHKRGHVVESQHIDSASHTSSSQAGLASLIPSGGALSDRAPKPGDTIVTVQDAPTLLGYTVPKGTYGTVKKSGPPIIGPYSVYAHFEGDTPGYGRQVRPGDVTVVPESHDTEITLQLDGATMVRHTTDPDLDDLYAAGWTLAPADPSGGAVSTTSPAPSDDSAPTPIDRAARVEAQWFMGPTAQPTKSSVSRARAVLTAAFDDPDLGGLFRDWRHTPCEHTVHTFAAGMEGQACSPCLRDRMLAWLLGGAR